MVTFQAPLRQGDGSESPKRESPEPSSLIDIAPPSKASTPRASRGPQCTDKEASVQVLDHASYVGEGARATETTTSKKRARHDSEQSDAQSDLETPHRADRTPKHPQTRTSNPRSLSKGSRPRSGLRQSTIDVFSLPSDIESTQEGLSVTIKKKPTNQKPVRRLGGPRFKPFEPQKANEPTTEEPLESELPGIPRDEMDRGKIEKEPTRPADDSKSPEDTPTRSEAGESNGKQARQPRRLADIQGDKPSASKQTRQSLKQNWHDNAERASAISKASTKVNGDETSSDSSDDEGPNQSETVDVDMKDVADADKNDTEDERSSASSSESSDEVDDAAPPVQGASPSTDSSEANDSDNDGAVPAKVASRSKNPKERLEREKPQLGSLKNSNPEQLRGGSTLTDETSSKLSTPQFGDDVKASARKRPIKEGNVTSKKAQLTEALLKQQEAHQDLPLKKAPSTPGKNSITAPIPPRSVSVSRHTSESKSRSGSLRDTPAINVQPKIADKGLRRSASVRRSVSFMDDNTAKAKVTTAPAGRSLSNARSVSIQPESEDGIPKPAPKPLKHQKLTTSNSRQNFLADLFKGVSRPTATKSEKPADSKPDVGALTASGKKKALSKKPSVENTTLETATNETKTATKQPAKAATTGKGKKPPARKTSPSPSLDKEAPKSQSIPQKEALVGRTTRASTARKNGVGSLETATPLAKTESVYTRRKSSETTTDSAIADIRSIVKGAASRSDTRHSESVLTGNLTRQEAVPPRKSSKTPRTGLRDSTRSRSPARTVETTPENDSEDSSVSGSEEDDRSGAGIQHSESETSSSGDSSAEDKEEGLANENDIETQAPENHGRLPEKQEMENPKKRSEADKTGHGKQIANVQESSDDSSSVRTDEHTEDQKKQAGLLSKKGPNKEGTAASLEDRAETESTSPDLESESGDEGDLPTTKPTMPSAAASPITQSSEEDAAGKQLRLEASQSVKRSSQSSKTPTPVFSSSQVVTKALSNSHNPSSASFGRTPTFTELKKRAFVAAPVQHTFLNNPTYKMPLKRQMPTKGSGLENSSDSSDTSSSDEGGPEDLWRSNQAYL